MKSIFTFLLLLLYFTTFTQVKVGENPNNVNNSALLEMESTSKGFLPPRMTTAQRDAIQNPASMLIIANTTTNCLEIYIAPNWQNIFCGCTSAPANLSYTDNGPITYCLNTVISPNSATTQASTPSSFTVSPSLPAGLQLNNVNGQITGTPTSLSSSANYTITASNACGSTTRVLNIGVITVPANPPTISGPSAPTINTSTNYSITAVSGATSYTWTVPTGWIINSGQGTTSIAVTAGTNAGNITVTAINTCGTSSASTKAVSSWRPIVATGGTVTNYTANGTNGVNGVQYRVHSFTTVGNSSFNISDAGTSGQVDYLVVAGGGGGSIQHAGGGGGGGVVYNTNFVVNTSNISITVGSGGINNTNVCHNCGYQGANGANSVFGSIVAYGGGGGGSWSETNSGNGLNGGSGGGGGVGRNSSGSGGTGTVGQGFAGGNGFPHGSGGIPYRGTGGGGAGGQGGNMGSSNGASGGIGILNYITGTAKYYGGGGGGGVYGSGGQAGNGGIGGGGAGGAAMGAINAAIGATGNASGANGEANTGGGGGSSGQWEVIGGNGGSGIIIVRYPLTNPNP
jgi:hypothetical protein